MANIVILADQPERISRISAASSRRNVDAVLHTVGVEGFDPTTETALNDCKIVILDHDEPSGERVRLVEAIRAHKNDARILITNIPYGERSSHADLIFEYLEHGAAGYVTDDQSYQLPAAIAEVSRGGAWIEPAMTTELVERTVALRDALATIKPHTFGSGQPEVLTRRQTEVLELLAEGMTNRQIADQLFISVGTVKNHVHRILDVLQASSRDQAAAYFQYLQAPVAAA